MWPNRRKNQKHDRKISGEFEPQPHPTTKKLLGDVGSQAIRGSLTPFAETAIDDETIAFDRLRNDTHQKMEAKFEERLAANPTPTAAERSLGTYVENLEPQVRNATMRMREKGYQTSASGFFGTDDDWRVLGIDNPLRTYSSDNRRAQVMDFREPFLLPNEVLEQLYQLGAETPAHPSFEGMITRIGFVPQTPDLIAIQAQWDAIADILPDTGIPAPGTSGKFNSVAYKSSSASAPSAE